MKYALLNPPCSFDSSIYFGCREPHLPLEYGYAKCLLDREGHEVLIVDGHLDGLSGGEMAARVGAFQPDFTVVTTAPSYLFWRCAPPELRIPQALVCELDGKAGTLVAIGPHGSTTPRDTLRKLGVDVVVLGEAEEILLRLAGKPHIDEIFQPHTALLQALAARQVKFGIQTRIDLWSRAMLDLLGRAGCVSIEAGVESISSEGRALLDKQCKLSTDELAERLIYAKQSIAFVQANLLDAKVDDAQAIERWRRLLQHYGVWANAPVPLFPYPGSPDYTQKWGLPDEQAWERAHAHYLTEYVAFSDIQENQPLPLSQLEGNPRSHA